MATIKQIEHKLNQINKMLGYSVEKYKPYKIDNKLVSKYLFFVRKVSNISLLSP